MDIVGLVLPALRQRRQPVTTRRPQRRAQAGTRQLRARNRCHVAAVHEAGHAVVGRVLGYPCGGATIIGNAAEGEVGYSVACDPWLASSIWDARQMQAAALGKSTKCRDVVRSAFRARILIFMAGAEAERELLGIDAQGDGDDRREIELTAQFGGAELSDGWEPRMRRQTRQLVRKHRSAIERVAHALIDKQTLAGTRLDRLVGVARGEMK
jgi:hypothetical protein